MENEYIKEKKIRDFTDDERDRELLFNIIDTREKLKKAHNNFEFADGDLVDYYTYEIKANQAKLDYLIKLAKSMGLVMNCEVRNMLEMEKDVGWIFRKIFLLFFRKYIKINILKKSEENKWQKHQKQYLYAMNVDMKVQNGWENVRHAIVGTHSLNKK